MAAKVQPGNMSLIQAKAFYSYLKDNLGNDTLYAGVSYIPDSDLFNYTGHSLDSEGRADSEQTFYGGTDSDYDVTDQRYYNQTMYSMHRVFPGGISRVIPRSDWVYGQTYKPYPDAASVVMVRGYDSGFVSLNVYQCLHSPRKPSYYAPFGRSNVPVTLADKYVWKYLYTITNSQSLRFLNSKYMPVPEKIKDDEMANITPDSLNYDQYIAQINSVPNTVYGVTIDSDALYSSINSNAALTSAFNWDSVNLVGIDKSNAKPSKHFRIQLQWDSETNLFTTELLDPGQGYLGPIDIALDSDSAGINGISAYVSPGLGHGSDIPTELTATQVMISVRNVADDLSQVVFDNTPFNLLTLTQTPIEVQTGKVAKGEFYITCNSFVTDTPNNYIVGDILKPSINDDGRRFRVLSTRDNKILYTATVQGKENDSFKDSESIETVAGQKQFQIKQANGREIVFNSGDLIMADFKGSTVERTDAQIESFNFVMKF